jgi:hypothetical protein
MRLEDYWGVGPKTSERLRETLGVDRAVTAIESADIRALTEAGISRGRATRILRRANGEAGMDLLATRDARNVYDDLLSLAEEYAVTHHAGDRIRVLTPLTDPADVEARLDDVLAARQAWAGLSEADRENVLSAFETYDDAGGTERAAVETALTLREAGLSGGPFDALADVDPDALREAAGALGRVEGGDVASGVDEELDRLRDRLADAESLEGSAFDLIDTIREGGVRNLDDFRGAFVEYVASETDLTRGEVKAATTDDAVDAADFVSSSLRTLVADLREQAEAREETVADELSGAVESAREDIDTAVSATDDIAFALSLARFADAHDLTRPELVADGLAVRDARNLTLSGDIQPITYAVGRHGLSAPEPGDTSGSPGGNGRRAGGFGAGDPPETPPSGDRVTVLTGANSGGKTTLLETLCQVTLLASMGLPVPAREAEVALVDSVVFHRRHASFNAGVLESTLKSIVPPLTEEGRALMLVDEFEAITEPGRAADLLNGLVQLSVDHDALGVYVTHLADDLSPLPDAARIDGIFAEGLTQDLDLRVDYQPRFGTVGKSTPEFIVSRLVANARGRAERQGFEALAGAVGEEAVQRTLSDVRWQED